MRFPCSEKPANWTAIVAAGLAAAIVAAYSQTLNGPFIFDDLASIPDNPTIRRLWPPWAALHPPATGITVTGRPFLNLSFAGNYAAGGLGVHGYHWANLGIHVLAALLLFGLVRQIVSPRSAPDAGSATLFAGAVALLWALHPLQTEAVTYIVQRAESLMGLFYLFTLYGFVRYAQAGAARGNFALWGGLSVLACFLGMATKEVMATAPLVALLLDRTFLSGSFRQAWRRHWPLYLCFAATWAELGLLIAGAPDRGGTAGIGLGARASWIYLRAQFPAIVHYLRLAVWPHPLILDYGTGWSQVPPHWLLCAAALLVFAGASLWAFSRRQPLGFCGLCVLLILAPSSSVIPVGTERMAEHRMYLPLAALLAGLAGILWSRLGRPAIGVLWALAVVLGVLTFERNRDYRTSIGIWAATAAARPDNPYVRNNLAQSLEEAGNTTAALAQFEESLRLDPSVATTHNNLGRALAKLGRVREAEAEFAAAVELNPGFAEAQNNLGAVLASQGRMLEARDRFAAAVRLKPDYAEALQNLNRVNRILAGQ